MKTLSNQTLLYDEDCPLCRVYTKGFITTGMLDENGKKPYCLLREEEQNFVDVKRASNEIALVDPKNKTVIYGLDSLLKVIGYSFPWMQKIATQKPIYYLLKKIYKLISYNRKVIIPSKINPNNKLQCIPDFSFKYRFIYILIAWLTASFIILKFLKLLHLEYSNFSLIAFGVFIQMPIQSLFLIQFDKKIILNYIGNLITISLFSSLLLIPILILNLFFPLTSNINLCYFSITFLVMIYEHNRRIAILQLYKFILFPWIISVVYLLYYLL